MTPQYGDGSVKDMDNQNGRFRKGEHRSPSTEFKPGQHWRPRREHWEKSWLEEEYVVKQRSAADIADQQGITENAVLYWLRKHDIPTRTTGEVRAIKHWGPSGEDNPMYGHTGVLNVNWRGGITPERQSCYSRLDWSRCVKDVWERDAGVCQRCRTRGSRGHRMHIHHIKLFDLCSDAEKCDPNMVLLLCCKCHAWVHSKHNHTNDFFIQEVNTHD